MFSTKGKPAGGQGRKAIPCRQQINCLMITIIPRGFRLLNKGFIFIDDIYIIRNSIALNTMSRRT